MTRTRTDLYFITIERSGQAGFYIAGHLHETLVVVSGRLSPFPGSPTIWVSHELSVPKEHRGKGYSNEYNTVLLRLATKLKASAVIASVQQDNTTQQTRLRQLGWRRMSGALWMMKPDGNWRM